MEGQVVVHQASDCRRVADVATEGCEVFEPFVVGREGLEGHCGEVSFQPGGLHHVGSGLVEELAS